MKHTVYVILRGGLFPNTFAGAFSSEAGALKAMEELRKEYPDLRFTIIEAEVQP